MTQAIPMDLAQEVSSLKNRLRLSIQNEVQLFLSATGLTPSAIRVDMKAVTTVDQRLIQHMVADVTLEFRL